ncbi:MAG: hypothetical protein J5J00_07580 [Deltaproteobacteria bacterium]|nr:hypothetical protein [Deltaproteobacteria bacterium]
MKRFLLPVITLSLISCSTGFDRGALRAQLAPREPQINDSQVQMERKLQPQVRAPFKMAIALQLPGAYRQNWRWNSEDRELVEKWGLDLQRRGKLSDFFIMNEMFLEGDSTAALRRAAARHGADAVLMVSAASEVDNYLNPSSLLYFTIVGAFIAPGSHKDALFMIEGELVDVNNGYLYAAAQSEGEYSTVRPAYFSEDKDALAPAKKEALMAFGEEISNRITRSF